MNTKNKLSLLIPILALILFAFTSLPASAEITFATNGIVYSPSVVLLYNSQGQPALMSFAIQEIGSTQITTIYCHRPYLSACTFVDSSTIGKKLHVTGVMEYSTWLPGWQPYAQSTGLVLAP